MNAEIKNKVVWRRIKFPKRAKIEVLKFNDLLSNDPNGQLNFYESAETHMIILLTFYLPYISTIRWYIAYNYFIGSLWYFQTQTDIDTKSLNNIAH